MWIYSTMPCMLALHSTSLDSSLLSPSFSFCFFPSLFLKKPRLPKNLSMNISLKKLFFLYPVNFDLQYSIRFHFLVGLVLKIIYKDYSTVTNQSEWTLTTNNQYSCTYDYKLRYGFNFWLKLFLWSIFCIPFPEVVMLKFWGREELFAFLTSICNFQFSWPTDHFESHYFGETMLNLLKNQTSIYLILYHAHH